MSISSKHPLYEDLSPDWETMRVTYRGERAVKSAGVKLLPPTAGQIIDGMEPDEIGYKNYVAYRMRARFPGFVGQAVEALLGIMHHKPATIELPSKMMKLMESATVKGESLENLLRKINENQLVSGRIGLLADVPDGAPVGVLPYIATYNAEDIINWDDGARDELVRQNLNLVVLNETEQVRNKEFEWQSKEKYRVLVYGDLDPNEGEDSGLSYRMGVFHDGNVNYSEDEMITPSIGGNTPDSIPFVFINSKDIVPEPDTPPLLGLAELALAVYRSEADYRQSLFMQGQDTLVVVGGLSGDDGIRAGAGAVIEVSEGGDAKYIGVESGGLPEQRMAIENDRKEAADIGGKLLDTSGRDAESGDALRIRVSARTASLNQIALASAAGLQDILRKIARWIGADENEVIVEPNLDFADESVEGRTLVDIMSAKLIGLPLSKRSIHENLREKDLTRMTFEEEQAEMAKEDADDDGDGGDGTLEGGDPNPDDPNDGE